MESLNRWAFLALNADSGAHGPIVWIAVAAAKYLVLLVPLHLVLIWVGGDRRMRAVAVGGLLSLVVALVVNQAIGMAYYSPRPFVVGLGHALIEHRASSSMPSNHATVFFAYAASLMFNGRGALAGCVAALGLLVAWSRIYLGIHYPLDMAVAAIVSLASAGGSSWIMSRWGARLLTTAERISRAAAQAIGRILPHQLA